MFSRKKFRKSFREKILEKKYSKIFREKSSGKVFEKKVPEKFLRKNSQKVLEKKILEKFSRKSTRKVFVKKLLEMFSRKKFRKSFREKIIEKFSRKKYSKSLREKYSKSLREKILEIYLIFFGPILGPIGGPRVRLKNRGLDLKTNKNKYTQMGPNILGLSMGPKNRASQYGAFLTALDTNTVPIFDTGTGTGYSNFRKTNVYI
jgi:hypothetical protein